MFAKKKPQQEQQQQRRRKKMMMGITTSIIFVLLSSWMLVAVAADDVEVAPLEGVPKSLLANGGGGVSVISAVEEALLLETHPHLAPDNSGGNRRILDDDAAAAAASIDESSTHQSSVDMTSMTKRNKHFDGAEELLLLRRELATDSGYPLSIINNCSESFSIFLHYSLGSSPTSFTDAVIKNWTPATKDETYEDNYVISSSTKSVIYFGTVYFYAESKSYLWSGTDLQVTVGSLKVSTKKAATKTISSTDTILLVQLTCPPGSFTQSTTPTLVSLLSDAIYNSSTTVTTKTPTTTTKPPTTTKTPSKTTETPTTEEDPFNTEVVSDTEEPTTKIVIIDMGSANKDIMSAPTPLVTVLLSVAAAAFAAFLSSSSSS